MRPPPDPSGQLDPWDLEPWKQRQRGRWDPLGQLDQERWMPPQPDPLDRQDLLAPEP